MSKKRNCICETCSNLIAIGEGDHICYEVQADDDTSPIMPISDYTPTNEYLKCGGEKWEEQ